MSVKSFLKNFLFFRIDKPDVEVSNFLKKKNPDKPMLCPELVDLSVSNTHRPQSAFLTIMVEMRGVEPLTS